MYIHEQCQQRRVKFLNTLHLYADVITHSDKCTYNSQQSCPKTLASFPSATPTLKTIPSVHINKIFTVLQQRIM